MIHKDFLGTEITVGDFVAYGQSHYADVGIGIVTKINPRTVSVNGSATNPVQCFIINEEMLRNHPVKAAQIKTRFKDKMVLITKKVTVRRSYRLFVANYDKYANDPLAGNPYLFLSYYEDGVLVSGKLDSTIQGQAVFRSTKHQLKIGSSYYNSTYLLPAKVIKGVFGCLPPAGEVEYLGGVEQFSKDNQIKV